MGSSPRMRGSLRYFFRAYRKQGIIPAHAGLTLECRILLASRRDHPRACGAHMLSTICSMMQKGSSPRMRGSHYRNDRCLIREGIIPAHAGLTVLALLDQRHFRDHPRACGAHGDCDNAEAVGPGSSPRMRGSPPLKSLLILLLRIIPAHAGLTVLRMCNVWMRRDHPRACGAHWKHTEEVVNMEGSSPRMRGSPSCRRCQIRLAGIIPAHAGLTCRACRACGAARDHPRACGAHRASASWCAMEKGSSPRMRGSLPKND